jgi:hypothetical protein
LGRNRLATVRQVHRPWRCGGNMHSFFDGAKQSPILAREF